MPDTPAGIAARLYAKMERRKHRALKWQKYYDGDHKLKFTSPEFAQHITGDLFEGFSDNWCQVVPDSVAERLEPTAFLLDDGEPDHTAMDAWRRSEADIECGLAMLEALVTGRAYGMVWRPEGKKTEISFHGENSAVVEYVPGARRKRKYGLIAWRDGDVELSTLFTAERVHRFQRTGGSRGQWEPRRYGLARGEPADFVNPMGDVPLVELPNRQRLTAAPSSELSVVAPLQDGINTLWADLFVAADELALPGRVVLGMDRPTDPVLDEHGEQVGETDAPLDDFRRKRLLWLEGRDASIQEFSAADLSNYIRVIERVVQHIAAQTRTPPHYLVGTVSNISADALAAAESGLVAKARERQRYFGAALRELMRLEAVASEDPARAESLSRGKVEWRDPQFRSDSQYADALVKLKSLGVPDRELWSMIPDIDHETVERWAESQRSQAAAIVGGDFAALMGGTDRGDE